MSLIAVKDYLADRGSVTLQELARELSLSPELAASQLEFLVARGKARKLVQAASSLSCASAGSTGGCKSCGSAQAGSCGGASGSPEASALGTGKNDITWYRWVG